MRGNFIAVTIKNYHTEMYPNDLKLLKTHAVKGHVVVPNCQCFGKDDIWRCEIKDENLLACEFPVMKRAVFSLCLYFEMLIDQAVHEYFPEQHSSYSTKWPTPKFGTVGMGSHFRHPNVFLRSVVPNFVAARRHIDVLLDPFAAYFVDWASKENPAREALQQMLARDYGDVGFSAFRSIQAVLTSPPK
jgi:hypothetical protein